ncbi:YtxH domain-containing protein [Nonlabens mediterrranea]|uniref:YtxH domain-containing protein n=1 Tax=Nonlabens mediterrranea TaxID=1419947 RepID=A0ABS0A597_9FLAO|nr:hypothetical protein BBFL7_01552 [Flavobacteria bacterium BBFL7]MBF4983787.1 YtxH domain-containing protein [Nonlabens mediterrranea]
MAKTGNALIAIVAGAAIGVAAGLLYAPESGAKTRKKLKKKADKAQKDIKNQAQTAYDTLTTKATEYKGTLDERIETALSTASFKADDAIVSLERKLEQLRAQNAKLQKPKVNGKTTV